MATPLEQLDLMRNLQTNWDGYGADAPIPEALELAKEFVEFIASMRSHQSKYDGILVATGRDGGVMIEWDDLQSQHSLDINGDGSIGLLHTDKSTQHMTEKVFKPGRFAVSAGLVAAFRPSASIAA